MVQYRRNFVPGGTYFFTLTLGDRRQTLLTDHADELRDAMRATHVLNPWATDAIVVLPDHMHMIWTLPDGDSGYAQRIRMLKARFTSTLRDAGRWTATESPWQARYWEHTIRDDRDFENHVTYIHYNPVKHGYAKPQRIGRTHHFIVMFVMGCCRVTGRVVPILMLVSVNAGNPDASIRATLVSGAVS